jgi:hypothetical protein
MLHRYFNPHPVKVMKSTRLLIGLIPALVLAVWAWSLSVHEWFDVPSPVFLLAPILALLGGVPWFIHSRSPRLPTVQLICVAAALLSCVIRIDWIVGTYYVYMDSRPTYQTHVAPSAPLWSPPTPNDTIPGTKSWDDFDYFYHGGAGGPTETPRLRLNWLAAISRFWSYLLIAYSACLLIIPNHKKPRVNKA